MAFQNRHAAQVNRHALVEMSRNLLLFINALCFDKQKIFDIIRDFDNQEQVFTIPT